MSTKLCVLFYFIVKKVPVITESYPDSGKLGVDIGDENVTLSCQVDAVPTANIFWTDKKVQYKLLLY